MKIVKFKWNWEGNVEIMSDEKWTRKLLEVTNKTIIRMCINRLKD